MRIKLKLTLLISKCIIKLCRLFKLGGTSYAGELARKIYPPILKELAKPYRIILVTGTNGKTTTTKIISVMLEKSNIKYITNKSGANLVDGIATLFLEHTPMNLKNKETTALIEIDEAALRRLADHITPDVLVVTNFFRDQLDRFGELTNTVKVVKSMIEMFPDLTTVINGDDSFSCYLVNGRNKDNILYYGISSDIQSTDVNTDNIDATYCIVCNSKYTYHSLSYGHLGNFECTNCGYKKPKLDIAVTKVTETDNHSDVEFTFDGKSYSSKINLPGLYNVYNSMAAMGLAKALSLPMENAINALESFEPGFGRMETIDAGDKKITMILVKNPNSFNQTISYLSNQIKDLNVVFALSDKIADGTDVSWIWDIDFEILANDTTELNNVYTCGTRGYDMAVRMKYAGVEENKINSCNDFNSMIDAITTRLPAGSNIYILPTYTAMLEIRKLLKNKFNLKEIWQ